MYVKTVISWPLPTAPSPMRAATLFLAFLVILAARVFSAEPAGFPYLLPDRKPDRPLSTAMQRLYDDYLAPTPEVNELYSTFKFTPLEGLDYHGGDGTLSRRDPSKVIHFGGKYYVWYTHRQTPSPPRGAALGTDTIPSTDWDLAEIWYATSDDGFKWQEQADRSDASVPFVFELKPGSMKR